MAASAETIAQSPSFHDGHRIVLSSDGTHTTRCGLAFWLGEYDAQENSMDVFWGTQKIGSLGLTEPRQARGITAIIECSVWVENDGYTTDSIEDAVLYMANVFPESTEEPEVIGHSQVVEELPQAIQDIITNMSAIECSELEDAILVAHQALIDASPDVADYIFGGNPLEVLEAIQERTFTYAQAKTAIVDLQSHSGRD